MRYLILFLLALPILAACASLSEDECRAGDWVEIGREDGADGRRAEFIRTHAKACAEYGIRPDVTAWEKGRQEGLKLYCTPRRAWEVGTRGQSLSPVCPAELMPALTRANDRGYDLWEVERRIDDTEREIREIRTLLSKLPPDDPARSRYLSELTFLDLRLLRLRAERSRLRFY